MDTSHPAYTQQNPSDAPVIPAALDGAKRARVLLLAFLALVLLLIAANLVFTLSQARQRIVESQYMTAGKLVQVLEQQTADSVNAVELALQSSAKSIQLLPKKSANRDTQVQEILTSNLHNLPFVRAIWVLDEKGNMIHDSERLPGKYNLSDREYFRIHRDNPRHGLYIDRPLLSRHGVWFIGVSLRIARPDGGFGGVIVAAFEPRHFRRFYQSIRIGGDGVVSLLGPDGMLMLRVPEQPGAEGKVIHPAPKFVAMLPRDAAGSYRTVSSVDALERIYVYRKVAGRPLVVLVGIGVHEALAPWRDTALAYVAASAVFLLLVGTLGYLALNDLRRRAALHGSLVASESALAAAQRLARMGSWQLDPATRSGTWSDQMYALLGMEKGATGAAPPLPAFLARLHPDDRPAIEAAVRDNRPWSGELRTNPAAGPVRYLYASGSRAGTALVGTLQDVTERHLADEKLRLAAHVFNHMQDGIVVTNAGGIIIAVNAAFERITGYREPEVVGQHTRLLRSERHDRAFYRAIRAALAAEGEWRGEIWARRKNGAAYSQWLTVSAMRDSSGRHSGYVGVFTDLSQLKEANAQLTFLANHDPLTRLPNRRLLHDRLQQALDGVRRDHAAVAVLTLNIDRLQRVNEGIGHDAGDAVLREIAQRLLARLPTGDTLARAGSDEFVVIYTRFDDSNDVVTFARQLLDQVAAPIEIHGHTLSVTACIGIALYPQDGGNAGELLKNADTALARAKQRGPDTLRFFTSEMNAQALHWISLEHALRGALARGEMALHYQPQVSLEDGRICGAESLLRWHSTEHGTVMPTKFIPLAEDTGLIIPIGEWVIREACAQAKAWQDSGLPPIPVAVNVSVQQIVAGTLVSTVRQALDESGLNPHCLEIELTESVLMQDTDLAIRQIGALRALGVRVSLDDFGTGYSSLAYLSRLPLDKLKIDQSFVRNITSDARSAAIARATIALAHGLGITVIAEGVEDDDQLDYLRAAGCDAIQGFIIGKPVPPQQLTRQRMDQKALASLLTRFASGNPGSG